MRALVSERSWGSILTRDVYERAVREGRFTDSEGFGLASDGVVADTADVLWPSTHPVVPGDWSSVLWFPA